MAFLLSLGLLVLAFHHLQSLPDMWPQNYHAFRQNGNHSLTCPLKAEKIVWLCPRNCPRKNCVEGCTQRKTLHLGSLSHRCTGLYTCANAHNNSHNYSQYLLIDEGHNLLSFSCSADSYTSPVLHCSLAEDLNRPSLVRVKAYSSKMNQDWKEIKIPQDGNPFLQFEVPVPGFCPFEEQVNPINVAIEIMSRGDYRSGHRSFYMRDIVVPRAPENVSIIREQIIWSNPSWTRHLSFFPLLFELRINYRNNTNVNRTTEEQHYNVKDVRAFNVRCRDLYNPSSWSSWTPTLSPSTCCSRGHMKTG